MIILGVDIGLDRKYQGNKGSSIVEFVLCLPLVIMFFYGIVFINSYFEKGSEIKITNRSVALSLEEDSRVLYEEFINKKEDDDNENNDQDSNKKDIFSVGLDKIRSNSNTDIRQIVSNTIWSLIKGKRYDLRVIMLANSLYKDYRYYSNIEANENKYEEDNKNSVTAKFRVHELSRKYLSNDDIFIKISGDKDRDSIEKSRLKTLFKMNYDLYTELNSGYLNDNDYFYVGLYGLGSGMGSLWGDEFVDDCLMDFSVSTACNGVNSFREQVEAVAAVRTLLEEGGSWLSAGAAKAFCRALAATTKVAISTVIGAVTGKIVDTVEEKAQEVITETYRKKIGDLGLKDYEG